MNYDQMREGAKTGDILFLEGRGLVSTLVRVLTAQQFSHVAMLLWLDGGLWVAEMRNAGFSLTPASQRVPEMQESGRVHLGIAPRHIVDKPAIIRDRVLSFRGRRYSWWTLATVWLSQITGQPMPHRLVCSTLIAKAWEAAGAHFAKTPDPGDFFQYCHSTYPIDASSQEGRNGL